MNQPHARPHDDFPETQDHSPTPPEPSVTLPVSLSKTISGFASPRDPAKANSPRYSRLGLHARGGLGEVFLAQDEELPREVALKEIRADRDDDHSRLRFLIEGTITGSLEHPGIVPVYSLGSHADGRPFYAMRLIRGQTLQQASEELSRSDFTSAAFRQLLQRLVTVCQTLQYAHDRGVIHRDLKPANIMVGSYGETLVVDWGLAKVVGQPETAVPPVGSAAPLTAESGSNSAETEQGVVLGTPAYMSPEQASGLINELTPATDIYALGATLYHLLTGQSPLKQPGQFKNPIERVREGDIAAPRSIKPRVPKPLEAICRKAMALHPRDRYASARELAADLERWLADEPLAAYREPIHIRAARWLRKHPVATATGATSLTLILLAALVISAISSTYSQQLTTAFNKLELQHGALAFANKELSESHKKLNATNGELVKTNAELKVARDEAKTNEKEALAREAETKTVLAFVEQHILSAARPKGEEGGLGRNVTLKAALLQSLPSLQASFAQQPLVEAQLRKVIGSSFSYLGELDVADEQWKRARELYAKEKGVEHPLTLVADSGSAWNAYLLGRTNQACEQLEATLKRQQTALGKNHQETLNTQLHLARVYEDLNRKPEALKLREATFAAQRSKFLAGEKPDIDDIIRSLENLAYSYLDHEQSEKAVELSQRAHEAAVKSYGEDHPEALGAAHILATMLFETGQREAALSLREKTFAGMKEMLGPDHATTLGAMHNLANSYHAAGRGKEALGLYRQAVAAHSRKLGREHAGTLAIMEGLMLQQRDLEQWENAIETGEETLKLRRKVLGPNHPDTIRMMRYVGQTYAQVNRPLDGLPLFEEAYRRSRDEEGADHLATQGCAHDLAVTYQNLDRRDEALTLLQRLYQDQRAKLGPLHSRTLVTMNECAGTLLRLRRGTEAAEMLAEVRQLREQYTAKNPNDNEASCYLAMTLGQLGDAHLLLLDPKEASQYYTECFQLFTQLRDENAIQNPFFVQHMRQFQLNALAAGKIDKALENVAFIAAQPVEEIPMLLSLRLRMLAARRDVAGVIATAEMFSKPPKRLHITAYQMGIAWSIASSVAETPADKERYAERAMEDLKRVKPNLDAAAEFATEIAQSYAYRKNPELDPLRNRADFKALLAELPAIDQ